jgi:hypothetical protein
MYTKSQFTLPSVHAPCSILSRVCRVQGLSCPGFVVSWVCRVQGLSVQGLSVYRLRTLPRFQKYKLALVTNEPKNSYS